MKRKLLMLTAAAILSLTACKKESYKLDIKALSPTGAPAVAMYNFAGEELYETTTDPQTGLMPMFKTDNYDVIIAPTQGGLTQIIKQAANFKIAATITFGNFYIVSMGTDPDGTLNAGDKVLGFQQNDIPGKVFKYLYGDLGLTVEWTEGVAYTKTALENNGVYQNVQYDYVYTAEPVLSTTNKQAYINIQNAFNEKTGGKKMTQASVFINNNADKEKINKFLSELESNIKDGLENPDLIQEGIEKLGSVTEQQNKIGVPGAVAKKVSTTNSFSLGYQKAIDIREDIQYFVNLLTNNTLGVLSDEVFYQ